jgi:antitoxin HicB
MNRKPLRSAEESNFRVVFTRDEGGVFVAECPSLPGCVSQGKTRVAALRNVKDAIRGYLMSLRKHGEPVPPGHEETVVRVSI